MITFFSGTNIFEYPFTISQDIIYPKATYDGFLPFQFHLTLGYKVTRVRLINRYSNEYIDISAYLIPVMKLYNTSLYTYFTYSGLSSFIISGVECGQIWQFEILCARGGFTQLVYSSYFELVDPSDFDYIKISNSVDFDNRIYSTGYYDIFYFDKILRLDEPYIEEVTIDKGDGTKFYESQIFAENYNIVIFGDKYLANFMEKLHRFDTITATFDEFTNEHLFDRCSVKKSYDEDTRLYQITMNFKLNEVEKLDCLEDYETITIINNGTIQDTLHGSDGVEIKGSDGNPIAITRY